MYSAALLILTGRHFSFSESIRWWGFRLSLLVIGDNFPQNIQKRFPRSLVQTKPLSKQVLFHFVYSGQAGDRVSRLFGVWSAEKIVRGDAVEVGEFYKYLGSWDSFSGLIVLVCAKADIYRSTKFLHCRISV